MHALEPHATEEGQEKKYSCMLTIPRDDKETLEVMKEAIRTAYESAKRDKLKGVKFERLKTTLRGGDEGMDTEERLELKDAIFINVSGEMKPQAVKHEGGVLVKTDDLDEVYSGVYAIASIDFYAYSTAGNKGVATELSDILTLCKRDFLGGRANTESDFGDLEQEDREGDMFS